MSASSDNTVIRATGNDPESAPVPKVSVSIVTYNHEPYIRQTLDGVVAQRVNFPFEVVIGEDCSTDRTRDVILDYVRRYPGVIRVSRYERNMGAHYNFRTTLARCRGQYIAYLDGDDYWTDHTKLSKQVALLDSDPSLAMCFHAVRYRHELDPSRTWPVYPPGRRQVYRLADLAEWMRIGPSSMMFRRSALPPLPDWFDSIFFCDYATQVLLAERGDVGYLNQVMGVKRINPGSIYFGKQIPGTAKSLELLLHEYDMLVQHLGPKRGQPFALARDGLRYRLAHAYLREGRRAEALSWVRRVSKARAYSLRVSFREPMLAYVHAFAPPVYNALRWIWSATWQRTAWHRGSRWAQLRPRRWRMQAPSEFGNPPIGASK